MIKRFLVISLSLLFPALVFAAVTDFTANSNITVSAVTFGAGTANMIIMSGSTAQSWLFNSGAFTVTNPGAAFQVASSDSTVKSIAVSSGGSTLACAANTTPGTSFATLPTASGTYTVSPSANTSCTSFCPVLSNTATYNAFPTCGALSCNAGYQVSGSGAAATCVTTTTAAAAAVVATGSGGPVGLLGSCNTGYALSSGGCVPQATYNATTIPPVNVTQSMGTSVVMPSAVFAKNLSLGMSSADVYRLQTLLASDKELYPEGIVNGRYGPLTKKAVGRFQIKYGVVSSSKALGYGRLGPSTRAKLQKVFGK